MVIIRLPMLLCSFDKIMQLAAFTILLVFRPILSGVNKNVSFP